jgi:hypothetical protein
LTTIGTRTKTTNHATFPGKLISGKLGRSTNFQPVTLTAKSLGDDNFSAPPPQNQHVVINRQMGKHDSRVFTYFGKPTASVNTKAWRNALERAGVSNFRCHDLRHTWASRHVVGGTPLHVLMELGGWSSYEMVLRYAHLAPRILLNTPRTSWIPAQNPAQSRRRRHSLRNRLRN